MRKTLLELTQAVLVSIDGDEVNSIADTTESVSVAQMIQDTYWDIVSRAEFPRNFIFFELSPSGDPTIPTVMYLPETQLTLSWVRYNKATTENPSANFQDIPFLDPDTFLQRMYGNDSSEDTVDEFDVTLDNGDTMTFLARNDVFPSCYTTFDDRTLIFDSYDSDVDTTLQESKTMCYGEKLPVWTHTDTFTPDLPAKQFSLLLNESKSLAWADLKQAQNSKVEQRARKGWIRSQKDKRNVNNPRSELDRLPNYGRK
jgi:hypothetical protein